MRYGLMLVALLGLISLVSCSDDDTNSADSTDPQIAILTPAANANVVVGDVLIRVEATDNVAVEKVEFFAGAILLGEDSTGSADVYEHTWDTSGLTSGTVHQIRARAVDTTGNEAFATISVTICPAGTSEHSDDITTDEIWYACWNPHTVTASLSVWQGGSLTIEPGCIIQFVADAAIYCASDGAIIADGTPEMPILFTSNETVPARGDWAGIDIQSTQPETHFGYCTIDYAGAADGQAVYVAWGGVLRMDHSIIRNSAGRGIFYEHGGHVEQFNNNTITDCADYPLALDADFVRHLGVGNDYTGNDSGYDAIEIYGGGVETSGTWRNQGVPYRITEGSEVWVGDQVTTIILTIEAGTTIEFESDAGMTIGNLVFAGLIAEGTAAAPITFTSAADSPDPGDWRRIWIADAAVDAQSRLSHCVIEYGGAPEFGSLVVTDALPLIEDCTIRHSSTYGIYLGGVVHLDPATLESQNEFNDNASGDVVWVE